MEVNATVFIMLFMFLMLLAWLSVFLFQPFLRIYEERERRIEGAAEEARVLRSGAAEKADLVEQKLNDASDEARKVLAELRAKGVEKERALIDHARTQSQTMLEDARADLFATTQEVRAELRSTSEKMADTIVEQVLGRSA